MPARKFRYVEGKGIIEVTDAKNKAVCDQIHQSVKKYQEPLEFKSPRKRRRASLYPRTSDFIGVNPDERKAAMEEAKQLGVPTYFNEQGDAVFESRAHENRYVRAKGLYHKNAGYGDVAPNNFVESTHGRKVYVDGITKRRKELAEQMAAIEHRILERAARE